MLSGIGPADDLARHGIPVRADLPGVGRNLQDHHEVPVVVETKGAYGYFGQDRGLATLRHGLQYVLFKSGAVTTTGVEACAFVDPDGGDRPTIQLYCVPTVYLDRDVTGIPPTHGVTLNPCLLRPKARGLGAACLGGSVRRAARRRALLRPSRRPAPDHRGLALRPRRSRDAPARGTSSTRSSFRGSTPCRTRPLRTIAGGRSRRTTTRSAPAAWARDADAVVTPDLKVRGIERLRIVDASIMPTIPSGNTNAPVLAVADRAADLIIRDR